MDDKFKFLDEEALKEMPSVNDLTLVAIKGHLIVECIINKIVASHCQTPEYLDKARLTFSQLTYLAQSLIIIPSPKQIFPAIHNLNRLRNQLAHNIDSGRVDELARKFVVSSNLEIDEGTTVQMVRDCICQIVGCLQAFGYMNSTLSQPKSLQGTGGENA
jgi:hypothetical protein